MSTEDANEMASPPFDARALAAIDMLRRTGLDSFQIRYSDDEQPVVWIAVGRWEGNGKEGYMVGAAMSPSRAVLELAEKAIDGGTCTHCHRPTGLDTEPDEPGETLSSMAPWLCWYRFDPDSKPRLPVTLQEPASTVEWRTVLLRQWSDDETHVASVPASLVQPLSVFGIEFEGCRYGVTVLCGVTLSRVPLIVMRPGVEAQCSACRRLAGA